MTDNEFAASLKELGEIYFVSNEPDCKAPDNRLTATKLRLPHCLLLDEICKCNPALIDLVTNNGRMPVTTIVTTATGAFCPALFNDELQEIPLWVFSSPHLSDGDAIELVSVQPTVVNHSPQGLFPETFLAWQAQGCTLLLDATSTDESLDTAFLHDRLLVAFAGGGTFSVQLLTDIRGLCDWLQCGGQSSPPDYLADELEETWESQLNEISDDIDFGSERPSDIGTGPEGETAYIAKVRQVGDATRLVPTRDIVCVPLQEATAPDAALRTLTQRMLESEGSATFHYPVVATSRGSILPGVIPDICRHFPLLVIILPEFMHDDCSVMANSYFQPVNVADGTSYYAIQGNVHELLLAKGHVGSTVKAAIECGELALVLVCSDNIWVRYLQIDSDWWDGTIASSSDRLATDCIPPENDNSRLYPHPGTSRHIGWYPRVYDAIDAS